MCKRCRPRSDCRSNLIRGYTVCHFPKYFKKQLHKSNSLARKVWNKVFEILGFLLYSIFDIRTTPVIRPLLDSLKRGLNKGIVLYLFKFRTSLVRSYGVKISRTKAVLQSWGFITKTSLYKYTENFTTKKNKFLDKKLWDFSYFCSKT